MKAVAYGYCVGYFLTQAVALQSDSGLQVFVLWGAC